jgi:exodeoxyribonuclease V alpha subunit
VSADNVQRPNILVPVYAAAIHKSQGSEYPAVAIPIMTQHYVMRPRRMGYYFLFQ